MTLFLAAIVNVFYAKQQNFRKAFSFWKNISILKISDLRTLFKQGPELSKRSLGAVCTQLTKHKKAFLLLAEPD